MLNSVKKSCRCQWLIAAAQTTPALAIVAKAMILILMIARKSPGEDPLPTAAQFVEQVVVYDIIGSDEVGRKNSRKIGTVAMQPSTGRYVYRWTIDRQVHSEVRLPQGSVFAIAAYDGVRWWNAGYSRRDPGLLIQLEVYDEPPVTISEVNREWVRRARPGDDAPVHGRYVTNAPLDDVAKWLGDPDGNPTRLAELIARVSPQREGIPLRFKTQSADLQRRISGQLDGSGELEWIDEHRSGGGSGGWVPLYVMWGCEFRHARSGLLIEEFESLLDVRTLLPLARNISWVSGSSPKRKSNSIDRPEVRDAGRAIDQFVP